MNSKSYSALPMFSSGRASHQYHLRSNWTLLFVFISFCGLVFYAKSDIKRSGVGRESFWSPSTSARNRGSQSGDATSRLIDSIAVSVKTGITIAGQRIAYILLDDQGRNIPEKTYYADADFTLGNIQVHDAYKETSEEIRSQKVFKTYFEVQESLKSNYVPRGGHDFWALSRYLDTHIQGQAYRRNPDKEWYMTIDDDTFVFWGTLLRWLQHFDSKEQMWLGHYDNNKGTIFANGGSGYIISGKMMRDTFGSDPAYATRDPELYLMYDAGDTRLGRALANHPNMNVTRPNAGDPSMNTERPRWITFSPLTWYLPVLTLGHMDATNNNVVRKVEKQIALSHGREDDIRFCDVYGHFLPSELPELKWSALSAQTHSMEDQKMRWLRKSNWRGNPRFVHQRKIATIEECEEVCSKTEDCYGYTFHQKLFTKKCHTFRLHAYSFGEPQKDVDTAWDLDKIRESMAKLDCSDSTLRQAGWEKSTTLNLGKAMVT